jgi:polysaccharide chain length determinant protein (PEP-CTERM system associated)
MITNRGELTIEDYKEILRRRIWVLVIPTVICAIGAYVVSIFLPSRYTSETVVLVEQPTVPENIVKPVVGGDVNQRLVTMQEQILSRTRLQQIIDKFGLYKDEVGHLTTEEMIALLRNSITVSPVRPMAETRANGLPGFTISVEARQPYLAQQICTEVTFFFTEQNLLLRQRRAEDTTEFLAKQLNEAKSKLDEQDAKLAEFQRRNIGALPEEMQTNIGLLAGLASQLEATSQALSRAQQDKMFVQTQLNEQLAAAKLSQSGASPDNLEKELAKLQDQLASLRARYTDEHPDVVKTRNEIARLQSRIKENSTQGLSQTASTPEKEGAVAETPQIQQLRAQLYQAEMAIRDNTAEQARLKEEISKLQSRVQMSPAIQQEYKSLTRDYQTALTIYNDLLKKKSDSEMATDLERSQEGETFRVLDPPSLPQKPTFPNRRLFAFAGLVGGLGLGLGIVVLLELQDTTMRTERDVELLLKLPTLVMIPSLKLSKAAPSKGNGSRYPGPDRREDTVTLNVEV